MILVALVILGNGVLQLILAEIGIVAFALAAAAACVVAAALPLLPAARQFVRDRGAPAKP